jgi:glucose/arabinose dehydrogenase
MNHLFRILLVLMLFVLAHPVGAATFSTRFIVDGLDRPVFLRAPPGDRERAFILEQHTGDIRILRIAEDTLEQTPFLSISGVATGPEQGLLGLAFHPQYATNGYFYVYLTDPDTRVLRYQVSADPDIADPGSRTNVLQFVQFESNHNGGWIGFGPGGELYIATGDGGGGYDDGPGHTLDIGNAQDITDNPRGKILRIDVDGDDFPADDTRNYAIPPSNPFVGVAGDDEIWAYGLRNPYRSSFDRLTGNFYIADVGQDRCEEVNLQPALSVGGENYGWRLREGTIETPVAGIGGPKPPGAIDPIMDYPHSGTGEFCSGLIGGFEGSAVTGGYVYRGPVAELAGRYFFADFFRADIWSLIWDGSDPSGFDGSNYSVLTNYANDPRLIPDMNSIDTVSSFGEDDEGNLYILDYYDGEVFRVPEPSRSVASLVALLVVLGVAEMRRRMTTPDSQLQSTRDTVAVATVAPGRRRSALSGQPNRYCIRRRNGGNHGQ